jgi:HEAT repeat protein
MAVASATALAPSAQAAAPAVATGTANAELTRLRDFLVGPDRTLGTRRDAAEVLLDKNDELSRAVLVEVLATPAPSGEAVLAVLDAMAARDSAPEALIDPLFQILRGDNEPARKAAALAFAAYQVNEKALKGLRDLATAADGSVAVRVVAIQALSQMMDKRAMDTLVRLAADPKPAVAVAACDALADMTGLRDMPANRDAWAEWWKAHQSESESHLLATLLHRFREDLKRREASLDRVQARLIRQLTDAYDAVDAKEKLRLTLGQLEDPVLQVRALAARQAAAIGRGVLAGSGNGTAKQPYKELIDAILKHLNDDAPTVRAAAAEALAAWQETSAGPVLVARLDTEKSPEVRAAVAAALGNLKVVAAVPKLVAMLAAPAEAEVLRAAGALGTIGEKKSAGAAAVEAAIKPLTGLAQSAPSPAVREAACLALAKIAPPTAEDVLAAALEDGIASVRFSAAQGLDTLGKAGDKTVLALVAHLQDENTGVRKAVAAALAKLGGPEIAQKMADRLKAGAESDPAVRNALWDAIRALVDRSGSQAVAQDLADRFFSREGAEDMQRAAILYEAALAKIPAASRNTSAAQALNERLVDAYLAAGLPDSALPPLRQLLAVTPPDNKDRVRKLNQQLGLILLAKEPYADAVPPLVIAMDGADLAQRTTLVKAMQSRADALIKADKPAAALELLNAFFKGRPDGGDTELTDALKALRDQAAAAAAVQAIGRLTGPADQVAAATELLKKTGRPGVLKLLLALEAAAKGNQPSAEARLLAALETVTSRKDHGYSSEAPLADRLKTIAAWRGSL